MVDLFEEEERARIEAAVATAERACGAEIVVMVVQAATDYRALEFLLAAVLALALPGLLLAFPTVPALFIWLAQLVLFILLGVSFPAMSLGRRIVGRARRERDVRAAAEAQFYAHGLRRTRARAAVLIFVAFEERMVELLYDDAAGAAVSPAEWRGLAGHLARRMKARETVAGLEEAAARAAELLAPHLPPDDADRNELPDLIVRS
ncbi:hypothetical protein [Parvularcula oceani]|uniref:hypothetical protein n=1 Tax=Parvularcula oceani TaxID=1247963 RepID=UPI00068FACFB|nr:hypothetical protein [Parvularcula oceani]